MAGKAPGKFSCGLMRLDNGIGQLVLSLHSRSGQIQSSISDNQWLFGGVQSGLDIGHTSDLRFRLGFGCCLAGHGVCDSRCCADNRDGVLSDQGKRICLDQITKRNRLSGVGRLLRLPVGQAGVIVVIWFKGRPCDSDWFWDRGWIFEDDIWWKRRRLAGDLLRQNGRLSRRRLRNIRFNGGNWRYWNNRCDRYFRINVFDDQLTLGVELAIVKSGVPSPAAGCCRIAGQLVVSKCRRQCGPATAVLKAISVGISLGSTRRFGCRWNQWFEYKSG